MEEEENQNKKIEKEVKKEAKKIQNGELKSLKHFFSTKKTKSKSGGRRKSKIKIEREVKKNGKNPKWRCGVSIRIPLACSII